jgi:glycosyltransferase involved in cell wall biosynthesis
MTYHIALNSNCDLEEIAHKAKAGKCPSHTIWDISQILGAKIHQSDSAKVLLIDKILAKIIGNPSDWALARQLSLQLNEEDVIFCNGEQLGIPIATVCYSLPRRPKIITLVNNLNRPRGRLALKLLKIADKMDMFVTYTNSQAQFLHNYLHLPENLVHHISSQPAIDTSFFTPGQVSSKKARPLIASGGLEKRDYRTLAIASQDLDVDVKVCAFSPNASKLKRSFPKRMPDNMSCGFYDWCDLVQLYRDSDLVVIPLFQDNYEAGLTTLFEALACQKPVIISRSSPGIICELIDSGIVTGFNPGDSDGLKQAIIKVLNEPQIVQQQIERGYELVMKQFNHDSYIQELASKLNFTKNKKDFNLNLAKLAR